MSNKNRFTKMLKRPHGAFLILVYLLTLTFIVLSIVFAFNMDKGGVYSIVSYVCYAFATISLGYSIYTIVVYTPILKKKILDLLQRNKITANILDNYGYKTFVFSIFSALTTLLFAVMNLVSAIKYRLIWYSAISAYYFILMIFRGGILLWDTRNKRNYGADSIEYKNKKWTIYRSGGITLLFLEIAMIVAVTEMMISRRPMQTGEIMAIANAAYTFYKVGMAIYHIVKARQFDDPISQSLRNVNFADACMSVVSLTVLMLSTFGGADSLIYIKASVGFFVCASIIALAIIMITQAQKQITRIKGEKTNG